MDQAGKLDNAAGDIHPKAGNVVTSALNAEMINAKLEPLRWTL